MDLYLLEFWLLNLICIESLMASIDSLFGQIYIFLAWFPFNTYNKVMIRRIYLEFSFCMGFCRIFFLYSLCLVQESSALLFIHAVVLFDMVISTFIETKKNYQTIEKYH